MSFTLRHDPPFRAEHIGSLLRPSELRTAFRQFSAGEITEPEFHQIQDDAIHAAVTLQEDAGLQVVTDGEFRRKSYWSHFVERVDGLTTKPATYRFHNESEETGFLAPHVAAKVRREQSISGDEFDYLHGITHQTPKITMPSPPTMHFWRGQASIEPGVYADRDAYFADLAKVFNAEILDLHQRGARYIQMDDVPIAMLCDPDIRDQVQADGQDPEELMDAYVDLINACVYDLPPEITLGLHLCRGNFKSRWLSEGGYESVAEKLFQDINVHAFFLEYDDERAGGFEPLRYLPDNKIAVLGLITTKKPDLEDPAALARRIDAAARFTTLDQLAISPQCGFSSTVGGNPLTLDDERRKLALVVEVARTAWGTA